MMAQPELRLRVPGSQRLQQPALTGDLEKPARKARGVYGKEVASRSIGRHHLSLTVEQERHHGRLFDEVLKRILGPRRLARCTRRQRSGPLPPALPDHGRSIWTSTTATPGSEPEDLSAQ